jgi:hypothetical protein
MLHKSNNSILIWSQVGEGLSRIRQANAFENGCAKAGSLLTVDGKKEITFIHALPRRLDFLVLVRHAI